LVGGGRCKSQQPRATGPGEGKMGQGQRQLEKGPASISIFRCKRF
jgi:hypothetical protein